MTIGATLREARSKKALTLDEVHAKIKIHPRVLQLLEEDKFDKLPSPLFVKSFLKSYADFLSVDAGSLIELYEREGHKGPEQLLFLKPASTRTMPGRLRGWGVAAAAAAVFMLGALVFNGVRPWMKKKIHPPAPKVAKIVPTASKKAPRPKPDAEAAKKSREWLRSAQAGNFPVLGKNAPLELKIKAVDNVWLRITCDKKVLFQSILKRGTAETWTANDTIEIWTGNSSNMVLLLNGYSLGSPGKGVVKKMVISREGVKIPS